MTATPLETIAREIHALMDGREWSADTLDEIGRIFDRHRWPLRDKDERRPPYAEPAPAPVPLQIARADAAVVARANINREADTRYAMPPSYERPQSEYRNVSCTRCGLAYVKTGPDSVCPSCYR